MPAAPGAGLLRRLLLALAFVVVVPAATIVVGHFAPGDATSDLQMSRVGAESIAATRARYGLDRPLSTQLASWLEGLAHFDLGESISYRQPVGPLVLARAINTARLAAVALMLALALGVPIGVLSGARPRGIFARIVTPISIALVACPPIVGALALLLLAVSTGWLSTSTGSVTLPALALALPLAATIERLQSRATTEALAAPDVAAAAARGIPASRLLWVHAARQSLRPLLGIFGVILGTLFSGSLAVEVITAWPGLGRLTSDAIHNRDLLLGAGCAFVGAVLIAAGNILADALRMIVDPRARVSS
jgi:peptide/nickel transport system permease protein